MNIHVMHLQSLRFEQITNGTKTIEVRIYDKKRQKLKVGDSIQFINNKISNKTITKTIMDIIRFPTLNELFQKVSLTKAGYPPGTSSEAATLDTQQYYDLAEETQFGVVAIFLS